MGLTFPNRVGLAAGFDKDGECINALGLFGFGFIEVGTVTPKPQSGNPAPRLFRDTVTRAVVNRLGFPNQGIDRLLRYLVNRRYGGVCGVNIGKNYDTPLETAIADYLHCYEKVFPHADYVALNVSSPNTPNLRELQRIDHLSPLLTQLSTRRRFLVDSTGRDVPLLLKLAPELNQTEVNAIAELAHKKLFDGVIATNTTVSRPLNSVLHKESGGLSGKPLHSFSLASVRMLRRTLPNEFPIIGVGGIMTPADAVAMLDAGADLVQIYTGMVFEGPSLPRRIRREFSRILPRLFGYKI